MSTSYYLVKGVKKCDSCGHSERIFLDIGQSSAGWCFALNIYPEIEKIKDLDDWIELFENFSIEDEYGGKISSSEMVGIITERAWPKQRTNSKRFHQLNHSADGPNNLVRWKIDGQRCIGHGKGTWDLFLGNT